MGYCALRTRWDPPSGSGYPSGGGVPRCSAWGSPPVPLLCAVGVRCWVGFPPPPSPPGKPLALGTRDRSGGGGPLLRRSRLQSGVFVPPLLPSPSRAVYHVPMAVLSCRKPRNSLASLRHLRCHLVVLTVRVLSVFGCSASYAVEVFGQVPCSAGSRHRLDRLVRRLRSDASRRAVATIGPFSLVALTVNGFSPPPPCPRPSSPNW